MIYVKSIFWTVQGEGAQAGTAAVFVRFTGCNKWSGEESTRRLGTTQCAQWCDTDFIGQDGENGGAYELSALVEKVVAIAQGTRLIVFTGGEPALQVTAPIIDALKRKGFTLAIETNGSIELPVGLDWVCVSPKALATGDGCDLKVTRGNELKLAWPQVGIDPEMFADLDFKHFSVQPIDGPDKEDNTRLCLEYIREFPQWKLSVQTHKMIGVA